MWKEAFKLSKKGVEDLGFERKKGEDEDAFLEGKKLIVRWLRWPYDILYRGGKLKKLFSLIKLLS